MRGCITGRPRLRWGIMGRVREKKTYRAEIARDGKYWSVRVPEVGRTTQARTLAEIEPMARDLIAVMEEVPEDSFGVEIGGDEEFEAALRNLAP